MTTLTASPITELPEGFRPLLRTEYDRLIDLGVFEGMKIELIGGVLVEMSPIGDAHVGMVIALNKLLVMAAGDDYAVNVQGPVLADDISEPEPDFAIHPPADYPRMGKRHEALLIIEVSESSLRFDLGEKARRYALAGYPEYWVIDVVGRVLHRHTRPAPDGTWGSIEQIRDGRLEAVAAPGIAVDLGALLAL